MTSGDVKRQDKGINKGQGESLLYILLYIVPSGPMYSSFREIVHCTDRRIIKLPI